MLTLFFIYHTCTLVGNFLKISYIWSLNPLDNISSASSKTNILILSVSEKKKMLLYHNKLFKVQLKKKRFVNRIKKDGKFLSLVKQQRRMFFSSYTSMGQRKKFWAPIRNWTSDHQILHSDVLPLSHRDSMVNKVHDEVQIWYMYWVLLGSAMLLMSCFVNRIRKMVSFELGKEIEKDVFFLLSNKTKKHLPLNKTLLPKETVKRTKLYSHKWDTCT